MKFTCIPICVDFPSNMPKKLLKSSLTRLTIDVTHAIVATLSLVFRNLSPSVLSCAIWQQY